MRGFRQSLGRIAEDSETSAVDPDSHARKTPHHGIESGPAVHFVDQLDGENSRLGEKQPAEGLRNANNNRACIWTRRRITLAIFIVYYLTSLQLQISNHLIVHTMSTFGKHHLTATNGIVASIIGAVIKLPMSKVGNTWGRVELFVAVVLVTVFGLLLAAVAKNVTLFMVAQTLCWIGYDAISYILGIGLADITSIKDRGWLFAVSNLPHLINTFVGPIAAQSLHKRGNWRWAYGAFAVILPLFSLPLAATLFDDPRRLAQTTHKPREPSEPLKRRQKVWRVARSLLVESDVIGGILLGASFAMLLLPLSFGVFSQKPSKAPRLAFMLALGVCLLPILGLWERHQLKTRNVALRGLINPTILGACIASAALFASFYCLDSYFLSYLQVVHNLTVSRAGYVHNVYIVGSCFFALCTGISIRLNGKYTTLALAATAFDFLATGLTIIIRQPNKTPWHIIANQLLLSFPGGTMGICGTIAVMAVVETSEAPISLALFSLFAGLGAATGRAVASALYINYMPKLLEQYLPLDTKPWAKIIYGSLNQQLSYPMGSAVRHAIIRAYEEFMRHTCIAGLGFLPLALLLVALWENVNVNELHEGRRIVV
ncbi:Siderophore iron transporter mirB [Talaromyces pinophilus]|nr:Siderophore iron transporter mirB [Talaromyces pinophilus]